MLAITIEKENKLLIQNHGYTMEELKKIPGDIESSPEGTIWKTMKIENLEITFFLDPRN